MSFGFAGAAAGASDELQQLLTQRRAAFLQQQQMQQQQAQQAAVNSRADQALALQQSEAAAAQAERAANRKQAADNASGLDQMVNDPNTGLSPQAKTLIQLNRYGAKGINSVSDLTPPTPAPPKLTTVTTIGPKGAPIKKGVTDAELAQGVPEYVAPKEPSAASERRIWVTRGGMPTYIDQAQVQPGDAPYQQRGQKTPTGADRQAFAFYNRAKQATDTIEGGDSGTDMETQIANMGLAGQTALNVLPNFAQSQLGQSYRQAQRAFTEARLRKESGAAINNAEYDKDAKTYFAQPGDTPETIAQKRTARKQVLEGLAFSSGPAYEEYFGEPFKGANKPNAGGGKYSVGQSVTLKNGQTVTIKALHPDGTFEY